MADKNQTLEAVEPVVEKKSRFKTFITNHPRVTAVAGVTIAIALTVGVVSVLKSKNENLLTSDEMDENLVPLESTEAA